VSKQEVVKRKALVAESMALRTESSSSLDASNQKQQQQLHARNELFGGASKERSGGGVSPTQNTSTGS